MPVDIEAVTDPGAIQSGSPVHVEGEDAGPFVLELCQMAEPIAIPERRPSQLNRFTFFCSRGQEGADEKYRLHMGYFATRAEAEKWLGVLKRLYPDAVVSAAEMTFVPEHYATLHLVPRREPR